MLDGSVLSRNKALQTRRSRSAALIQNIVKGVVGKGAAGKAAEKRLLQLIDENTR